MTRSETLVHPILLAVLALGIVVVPAQARRHKAEASDKATADTGSAGKSNDNKSNETKKGEGRKAEAGKPVEVGTYGDWGAYLAKGKGKTCYALAKPHERKPEGRKDAAYVFIADRPGEKVHNEVSIMMGFPIRESGSAQALIGKASFDLVAKGSNAWIKNPEDEAKFVEALQHSAKLVVKAPPMKGPTTVDSYSLAGLKQALDRVGRDCN